MTSGCRPGMWVWMDERIAPLSGPAFRPRTSPAQDQACETWLAPPNCARSSDIHAGCVLPLCS